MGIDHQKSYDRLREYADDLSLRMTKQSAWIARHPEIDPFNEYEYTRELHESDPFPSTRDLLSAQRFLDVMVIALKAFESVIQSSENNNG